MSPQLLTLITVHFLALVPPGPDFVIVSNNALRRSRIAGIITALGIAAGMFVHLSYTLAGIGFIISQSILLFNTIKIFGALYLIWIGYKSLGFGKISSRGTVRRAPTVEEGNAVPLWKSFREGLLTNMLNPKVTLFFVALFTQIVNPETPLLTQLFYGTILTMDTFLWFAFVAICFGAAGLKSRLQTWQGKIEKVMGAALIGLGLKVLFSSRTK